MNPDQSDRTVGPFDRYFPIFKWMVIGAVIVRAFLALPDVFDSLAIGDNDDIMRLLSVRAWIDGQDWYDMTQYRLLPPDGVSIHWSRYIDFGIALIVLGFATFVEMPQAEAAALVIWPTVLLIGVIWVVSEGTRRSLGGTAGIIAIASIWLWGPTAATYFAPGRIDHHNIQILMMVVLCFALIGKHRPIRRGIVAGLAAAFSLAVGLETLLVVALVGAILALRAAFSQGDSRSMLASFCITLAVAATILFMGQNHPETWFVATCDTLSPPFLSITYVAMIACLLPMACSQWLRTPALQLMATVGIAIVGLALCRGLLAPCLEGPYGLLPLEVQNYITAAISEAMPGLTFAALEPMPFNAAFTPVIGAVILASIMWMMHRNTRRMTPEIQGAIGTMLCICWLGLIAGFAQNRMIIMAAPAVPFLSGYVISTLLQNRQFNNTTASALALLAGVAVTVLAPVLASPMHGVLQLVRPAAQSAVTRVVVSEGQPEDGKCRSVAALQSLNAVPAGRILTRINLGPALILSTHHTGLAAPYHRSAAAIGNGFIPFVRDEAGMKQAVIASAADYVLLCQNGNYGDADSFANALALGATADWLRPIPLENSALILLAVESSK